MTLRKGQGVIVVFNVILLLAFGVYFFVIKNFEFVAYHLILITTVAVMLPIILLLHRWANFSNRLLWALTGWGVLHLVSGAVYIGGERLYDVLLVRLSSTVPVLRVDQLVHVVGLFLVTLIAYRLLFSELTPRNALILVGIGAVLSVGQESYEAFLIWLLPQTGVGDWQNTVLDLVSDVVGILVALGYLQYVRMMRT